MKTEIINFKTDPIVKKKAQKIARDLGFSLSSLLNAYMRHLIDAKTVTFSAEPEVPSEWLIESLERASRDKAEGWISPAFNNVEDSIAWLKNPNRRYINGKTDGDAG